MGNTKINNPFAERVEPNVARKGKFIKSFPFKEKKNFLVFCRDVKFHMRLKDIPGSLVYTEIRFGKFNHTWQVYVLPEEVKHDECTPN